MVRPRKRSPRSGSKADENDRPSIFFITLLVVGLLMLVWLFIQGARSMTPAQDPPVENPPAAEETRQ